MVLDVLAMNPDVALVEVKAGRPQQVLDIVALQVQTEDPVPPPREQPLAEGGADEPVDAEDQDGLGPLNLLDTGVS